MREIAIWLCTRRSCTYRPNANPCLFVLILLIQYYTPPKAPCLCNSGIDFCLAFCCTFRHLRAAHKDKAEEYERLHSQSSVGQDAAKQPTLAAFATNANLKYGPRHPDQLKINAVLLDVIVDCGLPISIVEREAFRKFVATMHPKYKLPCRSQITSSMLPALRDQTREHVRSELSKAQKVALTMDIWTDRRMHSYLALTAHTFVQCSSGTALLVFQSFKGKHTGVRIAEVLDQVIEDHDLKEKVDMVVTDNASNMRKAFAVAQEFDLEDDEDSVEFPDVDDETAWNELDGGDAAEVNNVIQRRSLVRLSCFAHSLQLTVKDGLKANTSRLVMAKCSKLASMVHQSALFRESFERKFGSGICYIFDTLHILTLYCYYF